MHEKKKELSVIWWFDPAIIIVSQSLHVISSCLSQLAIKPSGFGKKVKIPVDIIIGTIPTLDPLPQKTSYHPLPSIVKEDVIPFPFFELGGDPSQYNLPTAPPWEEDDDIPWVLAGKFWISFNSIMGFFKCLCRYTLWIILPGTKLL